MRDQAVKRIVKEEEEEEEQRIDSAHRSTTKVTVDSVSEEPVLSEDLLSKKFQITRIFDIGHPRYHAKVYSLSKKYRIEGSRCLRLRSSRAGPTLLATTEFLLAAKEVHLHIG